MADLFLGLQRKRLPGMNLPLACDGGMSLRDALASHFFMMLHDRVMHNCLIKEAIENNEERVKEAAKKAKSAESATMAQIFGLMGSASLAEEEWSYLDDNDVFVFYIIADTAIEQVQRWIAEGSHKPLELPNLGGAIVQRPDWAARYFGTPKSPKRKEARLTIEKLSAEIEVAS
jgi:hypothetical protein